MNTDRKSTYNYKFVEPQLKVMTRLSSRLILDNKYDFKKRYGNLLGILNTKVNVMVIHMLVQFYDPPLRCFIFQDYQLAPILEEYSHILKINIKDQVPFNSLKELLKFHQIAEALYLG